MSEETPKEVQVNAPPLFHLIMAGISSTLEYMNQQEQGTAIGPEQIFKAFAEGVQKVVPQIGYGLHALTPKQEKYLAVLHMAQKNINDAGKQDELELKLVAVPKRVEGGLVGADGKPLTKDQRLILAK